MIASSSSAAAYEADAGSRNCTQMHGTVTTKGRSNPGSQQTHKHDGYTKNFAYVVGTWYNKYWNRGEVSAAWWVEANDYSGVTGDLDLVATYGYCID